ncbi:MAG: chemotaxis protein CheW [Candidatus Hermodarchaeota archaeon]
MVQEIVKKGEEFSIIIFQVGWEQFAIESNGVKEIIQAGRIRRLPKSEEYIEGIYNYRGDLIHVVNLKKKLKLNEYLLYQSKMTESDDSYDKNKSFLLIITLGDIDIGFLVDRIINVAHITDENIEPLSPIFQTSIGMEYIRGILKLKDRPRILLDLNRMLAEVEHLTIQEDK